MKSCNLTHVINKADWTYPGGGLVPAGAVVVTQKGVDLYLKKYRNWYELGSTGARGRGIGWLELPQPLYQSILDSLSSSRFLIADHGTSL